MSKSGVGLWTGAMIAVMPSAGLACCVSSRGSWRRRIRANEPWLNSDLVERYSNSFALTPNGRVGRIDAWSERFAVGAGP
jgi:hypothetical protein